MFQSCADNWWAAMMSLAILTCKSECTKKNILVVNGYCTVFQHSGILFLVLLATNFQTVAYILRVKKVTEIN